MKIKKSFYFGNLHSLYKSKSKSEYFIKISCLDALVPGLMRYILDKNWETVKYFFTHSNLLELLKELLKDEKMSIYDSIEKVGSYSNEELVFKVSANSEEEVKKLIEKMVATEGAVCPFTYVWTGKGETDYLYKENKYISRKTSKKLSDGGNLVGYQIYLLLEGYQTYLKEDQKIEKEKFRYSL